MTSHSVGFSGIGPLQFEMQILEGAQTRMEIDA
jgi:hypothetical protein